MYAIIEESGGQRKVMQGEEFLVNLIEAGEVAKGKKITFDKVLVVGEEGGNAKLGQPYVAGASVSAEVTEPVVMGEKLDIQYFSTKKAFQKKIGHRQRYTQVKVTAIAG